MRKKIIIALLALIILLAPIKITHYDGGTKEYKAILYRVVVWNKMLDQEEYKTGIETHIFPKNFKDLEYFIEPRPKTVYVYQKIINNNKEEIKLIRCNTGSYSISKKVGKEIIGATGLSINPVAMEYKETIKTSNQDKIYLEKYGVLKRIDVYYYTESHWYKSPLQYKTRVPYLEEDNSFDLSNLEKGEYVISFLLEDKTDSVNYSFKLNVE